MAKARSWYFGVKGNFSFSEDVRVGHPLFSIAVVLVQIAVVNVELLIETWLMDPILISMS